MNEIFYQIYVLITGENELTSTLWNHNEGSTFFMTGLIMLLLSLAGMAVYYYVINHPKFSRWLHWLLVVIVICLINFGIAYAMADGVVFDEYGQGEIGKYTTQIVTFGFANAIWSFIFSFIFSLCIKWGSRNCNRSPF